ncbi:hypothetical protein CASFOL_027800 [Castilleja foliolosa]|uniref:F-box domain-containing protein n=1 Tax=Castilleja foliolosa TaxID=1961234 RepID=A0ABD3CGU0_9LAMI
MPPKKLKSSRATNIATAAAVAACEDLMLCVLARLPVKSIIRFKSVCKSWNHLLSTQEFVKLQFKLSSESKNQSFLVRTVDWKRRNTISVFNIESNEKKAKILDNSLNYTPVGFKIVGCCRGLVCIGIGQGFILWNPAMNLSKVVSPLKDHGVFESASLGFGYDAEGDDFKVVRIVFLKKKSVMCVSWVEVYSVNSDSWTTINPGFQFSELLIYWIDNNVTVNGNPYWFGMVDKFDVIKDFLICFDMSKLVFKIVPLLSLDYNVAQLDLKFVDLNGSLGALVFTWAEDEDIYSENWNQENEERIEYVDYWVFDDGEQIWTKSRRVGPIEVKMGRVLRSLKDGRILSRCPKGQLIVFNTETNLVKGLFNVGHEFGIYDYTASLAYIQGMEKVTLRERWH